MDIYLIFCVTGLYYFIWLCHIFWLWPFGVLSVSSRVPVTYSNHCWILFICFLAFFAWASPSSLALHEAASVSCVLLALFLESAIYPRSLGSFNWRMVWEAKIFALSVLVTPNGLSLLGPFSLQNREIYGVYMRLSLHIYTYFIDDHLYLY